MQGNKKVIDSLNQVLTNELTAINQYFLHSRMCANWGFKKLAKKNWDESIDEMKHAHVLTDRILFLEGVPNLQKLGSIEIGETVEEQLKADLNFEYKAIPDIKKAIAACLEAEDHATRDILEKILISEEDHADWLETQLSLIKELGRESYLSEQISDS
jgi:bacterioferritin